MDAALLKEWGPFVGAAVVGVLPWVKMWRDGRKARATDAATLIKLAQQVAEDAIKDLRNRVKELEDEVTELRKEHAQSIAAKDAKIALLEGELRQAWATADAYERLLTDNDIPHEKPSQPIWRVPASNGPHDVSAT